MPGQSGRPIHRIGNSATRSAWATLLPSPQTSAMSSSPFSVFSTSGTLRSTWTSTRTLGCARAKRFSTAGNQLSAKSWGRPSRAQPLDVGAANAFDGFVVDVEHPLGVAEQAFAGGRQGEPASGLLYERLPDLQLELPELRADGGLRTAETLGRPGEAAEFEPHDEGSKHIHVEIGA